MIIEWDGKFEWDDTFGWDDSIKNAKMNAGKTTQVRNHCIVKLIPSLNQRKLWVSYVRGFNPERPEILQPEFCEEHYFKYIGRWFVLKHDAKKKVWRLCFLRFVKDHPPGYDAGAKEEKGTEADDGAHAEMNRNPIDGESNDSAVLRANSAAALRLIAASYSCAHTRITDWRRGIIVAKWNLLDAIERVQDHVLAACTALRLRRAKVAVSLTALVRELREAAAFAPREAAVLQHQRVSIGGSRALDICVYVPVLKQGAWHLGETPRLDFAIR